MTTKCYGSSFRMIIKIKCCDIETVQGGYINDSVTFKCSSCDTKLKQSHWTVIGRDENMIIPKEIKIE